MVFSELHRCADMVLSELIGDQSVLSDVNCKGMSWGGGGVEHYCMTMLFLWQLLAYSKIICKHQHMTDLYTVFMFCSIYQIVNNGGDSCKEKIAFCIQCSQLRLPNIFWEHFPALEMTIFILGICIVT